MSTETSQETKAESGSLSGAILVIAIPYVLIGLAWAMNHMGHLDRVYGLNNFFSFFGEVLAWPILIFSDITLK